MKSVESERCRIVDVAPSTGGTCGNVSTQLNHIRSSSALRLTICQPISRRRNLLITITTSVVCAHEVLCVHFIAYHTLSNRFLFFPLMRAAPLFADNFAEILFPKMTTARAHGMR